jgi:transposase
VVCPTAAQPIVFQAYVRAVNEHAERLQRLEQALHAHVTAWRLYPVVEALQALHGVPCTVAVTTVAALGDRTRFENPRPLMKFWGLIPSAYASGERRRQGALTTAGNPHARRALVEGAWAYRYPAKGSRHLQLRLAQLPNPIQDISWKAPVRLCKRFRRVTARGQHATQVVVAIARELAGFLGAIAKEIAVTPSASTIACY